MGGRRPDDLGDCATSVGLRDCPDGQTTTSPELSGTVRHHEAHEVTCMRLEERMNVKQFVSADFRETILNRFIPNIFGLEHDLEEVFIMATGARYPYESPVPLLRQNADITIRHIATADRTPVPPSLGSKKLRQVHEESIGRSLQFQTYGFCDVFRYTEVTVGEWPSGKAADSGSANRRFESFLPSHDDARGDWSGRGV